MEYNNELKTIDTEAKAYLLGMFLADGCITTKNANRLSLVDQQIIDDLHKHFPFFNKGSCDFSKYNESSKVQYSLTKKSKELQDHFIEHGLVANKSTEGSEDIFVKDLSDDLTKHLLRGYFDGNGSISIPTARPNLRRAEFCSSSKKLINQIKDILEKFGLTVSKIKENPNTILYVIEWWKNENIVKLKDILYKDATIYLKRKKDIFDSHVIKTALEKYLPCIHCDGGYMTKEGFRSNKQGKYCRYRCTICKKYHQLYI